MMPSREDKPPFFTANGGGKQFGDYDERHLRLGVGQKLQVDATVLGHFPLHDAGPLCPQLSNPPGVAATPAATPAAAHAATFCCLCPDLLPHLLPQSNFWNNADAFS